MNRMRTVCFPTAYFASQPRRRALPHFMVALALCALLSLSGSTSFAQWPVPRNAAGIPAAGPGASANAALPAAAQKSAPAASGAGGPHDGIVVHGHWVIDVKNPDGSVAEHRDFENNLGNTGNGILQQILIGQVVPAGITLYLCNLPSSENPVASSCLNSLIIFALPGFPETVCAPANDCFAVLSESSGASTSSSSPLVVTGTATLPSSAAAITANTVQSGIFVCSSLISGPNGPTPAPPPNSQFTPASCLATPQGISSTVSAGNVGFTGASMTAVTINPGQSITVTFNLSFTSAS
jgi:hypothetical protein